MHQSHGSYQPNDEENKPHTGGVASWKCLGGVASWKFTHSSPLCTHKRIDAHTSFGLLFVYWFVSTEILRYKDHPQKSVTTSSFCTFDPTRMRSIWYLMHRIRTPSLCFMSVSACFSSMFALGLNLINTNLWGKLLVNSLYRRFSSSWSRSACAFSSVSIASIVLRIWRRWSIHRLHLWSRTLLDITLLWMNPSKLTSITPRTSISCRMPGNRSI